MLHIIDGVLLCPQGDCNMVARVECTVHHNTGRLQVHPMGCPTIRGCIVTPH